MEIFAKYLKYFSSRFRDIRLYGIAKLYFAKIKLKVRLMKRRIAISRTIFHKLSTGLRIRMEMTRIRLSRKKNQIQILLSNDKPEPDTT